jgi:hypothetical protein
MMIIPGFLITLVTFPGVIVHEFAHQLMCWLLRIPVMKVCYFQVGIRGPAGYVIHAMPKSGWQSLLIGFGPFLVNTLLGMIVTLGVALHLMLGTINAWDIFVGWLGISIAMHSFPSTGDAKSIWKSVTGPKNSALEKIVAMPLIGLIVLGAAGSVFWLDLAYGVAMTLFVPEWIIGTFAKG